MSDDQASSVSIAPAPGPALGPPAPVPAPDSDELPAPGTTRWVIRRKASVVAGVHNGLITLEEACQRYNLSVEEFLSWQRQIERHGLLGLRTTRLQDYRRSRGLDSNSNPG
jgi:hypothetical protein